MDVRKGAEDSVLYKTISWETRGNMTFKSYLSYIEYLENIKTIQESVPVRI